MLIYNHRSTIKNVGGPLLDGYWASMKRTYSDDLQAWAYQSVDRIANGSYEEEVYYLVFKSGAGEAELWVPDMDNESLRYGSDKLRQASRPKPVRSIGWAVNAYRKGIRHPIPSRKD